jgi:hypothetical protein
LKRLIGNQKPGSAPAPRGHPGEGHESTEAK